ncbi:MAG: transposase [Candidatus Stygibacter frigidus]|nr:transposase [Candidatus Stygibacter frigidus]
MDGIKFYQHNPPHLYCEGGKYFITGATYKHNRCFADDHTKEQLLNSIKKGFFDKGWILEDWVIMDDHYHLMVDSKENNEFLKTIMNSIHRFTATWLNKRDKLQGRKVWYNYWDSLITYESSYYARLNYLWYNPVKHGYCNYAENYKFGSFRERYLADKNYMEDLKAVFPWDELDIYDM